MSLVQLVTETSCQPLNFFRKLPPTLKVEIDDHILYNLPEYIVKAMVKKYYIIDMIFSMTPEKADFIQKYADDGEYFTILEYFEYIYPIYKQFFNSNDYYERYPEYLV